MMKTKENIKAKIREILKSPHSNDNTDNKLYDHTEGVIYSFFKSHKENFTREAFLQGLLMIYGWMPKIPKNSELDDISQLEAFEMAYTSTRDTFTELPLEKMKAHINKSLVGLSKMLHFINPSVFPIWDSNIARVFGLHNQMDEECHYINYTKAIQEISEKKNCTIRSIEKRLFVEGQMLSKEARAKKKGKRTV